MSILKTAEQLTSYVDAKKIISPENIEKLQKLSSNERFRLTQKLNGQEDVGNPNLFKLAFLLGKHRFQKEAENLIIHHGISELRKLQKTGSIGQVVKAVAPFVAGGAAGAGAGILGGKYLGAKASEAHQNAAISSAERQVEDLKLRLEMLRRVKRESRKYAADYSGIGKALLASGSLGLASGGMYGLVSGIKSGYDPAKAQQAAKLRNFREDLEYVDDIASSRMGVPSLRQLRHRETMQDLEEQKLRIQQEQADAQQDMADQQYYRNTSPQQGPYGS